jgi:cellulase
MEMQRETRLRLSEYLRGILDAKSHPINEVGDSNVSCGDWDSGLNPNLCATEESCVKNCAVDGVEYAANGVRTSGDALTLQQYMGQMA